MSETKKVQFGEAKQKELDNVVRKLANERKAAVEAELERRLSYRDEGKVKWQAYARFLLSDGHMVYVNLRTMEGSVSKTPDKFAQAKVAKREVGAKKAADWKAETTAKKEAKVEAKPVKVVPYDPKIPTVPAGKPKK